MSASISVGEINVFKDLKIGEMLFPLHFWAYLSILFKTDSVFMLVVRTCLSVIISRLVASIYVKIKVKIWIINTYKVFVMFKLCFINYSLE